MLKFHPDKPERIRQAGHDMEQIDVKAPKSSSEEKDLKHQSGTNERAAQIDHKTKRITFERIKQKLRSRNLKQSPKKGQEEGCSNGGSLRRPKKEDQEHGEVNLVASAGRKVEEMQKMAVQSPSAERVVVLWGLGGVG